MNPEVAVFWQYLAGSLDRLAALVGPLDAAELGWRPPADGANSLRVLAVHTFGNAEENLAGLLGGEDVRRDRDAEFRAAAGGGDELERRWASLRPRLEQVLAGLDAAGLERPHAHPRRQTVTGREILLVVARHAAEHLGQAELTRDLLRQARRSGPGRLPEPMGCLQVVTTADTREEADRLARSAVEHRLAACAQVVGPVTSTYWWEGALQTASEWQCVLKTTVARFEDLRHHLEREHSYDTPEIVATPIVAGGAAYLDWIERETSSA